MTDYADYTTDTSTSGAIRLHHGTVLDGHVAAEWPVEDGEVTLAHLTAAARLHDHDCHTAVRRSGPGTSAGR